MAMQFFKSVHSVAPAIAAFGRVTAPQDLDVSDRSSIINVASSIAYGAMSYYTGNVSSDPSMVGALPNPPYYWWEAGSLWNNMIDYYHYTGDWTYNDELIVALLAPQNVGANLDYLPADRASQEGNDDLGFWGSAAMTAAEINFPQPNSQLPSWLQIADNVFNSLVSRWDTSGCGGGLLWQIYPGNPNGLKYKNSVSNGGFMLLAARLYRATGNSTYLTWATTVWDWSSSTGLVDGNYFVYDGMSTDNCGAINKIMFTYSSGIYLYSNAILANATNTGDWADHTTGLLAAIFAAFFHSPNATEPVMFEAACEPYGRCNTDMLSHKATLARYMWKTALMQPALAALIDSTLTTSALAAAQACTGGSTGWACGAKWYTGAYDGLTGCGQEMSALAVVQGLLAASAPPPLTGTDLKVVRDRPWASSLPSASESVLSSRTVTTGTTATATSSQSTNGVRGRFGVRSISSVLISLGSSTLLHLGLA